MAGSINNSFRFLVADDSSLHRVSVIQMLRILGFNDIDQAVDGIDAIDKLRSDQYDFLITDWNMPRLNGIELVDTMKRDRRLMNVHVIMMTNRGEKQDVLEALKNNITHYLVKPVTPESIDLKIKACTGAY